MKTVYYNNLPHLLPIGATFFITYRLHGSIPAHIISALKEKKQKRIRKGLREGIAHKTLSINEEKRYFAGFDHYLDSAISGPTWLKQREVAEISAKKIHSYDQKYYDLIAYCIMSNHIHLVIDTSIQLDHIHECEIEKKYVQLYDILKLIKGGSAYETNQFLGRKGKFWQKESYDHFVRDDRELKNIISYTLQNPVKAGLVENWEDWPFSYVNSALAESN